MSTFEQPSAFESVLRFLNRPGALARNVMKGNIEGAYRQGADILGDITDATLPGDWIPEFSRKQDTPEFSDVIGGMEPGWAKTGVDLIGGIATDPLTYIGVGPVAKAVGSAARNIPKVDEAIRAVDSSRAMSKVRGAIGAQRVDPFIKESVTRASNAGMAAGHAVQDTALNMFKDVPQDIFEKGRDIIENVIKDPTSGTYKRLSPVDYPARGNKQLQEQIIDERLALTDWDQATKDAVRDYAVRATDFARTQHFANVAPITRNTNIGRVAEGGRQLANQFKDDLAPLNYHPRSWEQEVTGFENSLKSSTGDFLQSRSILTPEQYIEKLNAGGVLKHDTPEMVWGKYGESVGRKTKFAKAADELLGTTDLQTKVTGGGLGDQALSSSTSSRVRDLINGVDSAGDYDTAAYLKAQLYGLEPRGAIGNALAKVNQVFKPFATAGSVIPRASFNVRNAVSSIAQTISNPESRKVALEYAKTVPESIVTGGKEWIRELGAPVNPSRLDQVRQAAIASGGNEMTMLANLKKTDPSLAEAFETGVLDSGFTSVEQQMAKNATPVALFDKVKKVAKAPQTWAHETENKARLALFEKLRANGFDPENAARVVKDTMFDYSYSSEANRAIRDVIPFAQFTMKAGPQFAKFAMEGAPGMPSLGKAVIPAVGGLYRSGDEEHPLPQYLANQPTLNLFSENGTSHYLTSLGLPFETLSSLPNPSDDVTKFGRQVEQGIVSQVNPLVKFGYSMIAGHDPYFGSDFASYSKTPDIAQALGAPESSEASRYYNLLASTGMIQPLASPIQLLSQATDTDTTIGEKALSLSGLAKVATVDDSQALQQQLQNYLSTNPHAQEYRTFYSKSTDPDTLDAIKELQKIKYEMKKRKKEAGG